LQSTLKLNVERVLVRAKLTTPGEKKPKPIVTFHGLRHTAAARAFARGVPLLTISRQLGHANPAITAKIYAHLHSDAQLDEFADAMTAENLREHLREASAIEETA
jgi:integrase